MTGNSDNLAMIEALECLGDLPLQDLAQLMQHLTSLHVHPGETVVTAGAAADAIFFVGAGRLVQMDQSFDKGALAGWPEFVYRIPYDENIVAERECLIYRLDRAAFDQLTTDVPTLMRGFLTAATPAPLGLSHHRRSTAHGRIGIIALSDTSEAPETAISAFADETAQIADPLMDIGFFGRGDFDQAQSFDQDSADPDTSLAPLMADWLGHLDEVHDRVVLTATARDPAEWQARVITECDVVVLVTGATWAPRAAEVEAALTSTGAQIGLVVTEDEGTAGAAVVSVLRAAWPALRVDWHYRLYPGGQAGWDAVVRMAFGQAVNLVLSGGGALGAMHCGILAAMREKSFPIDTVGGTSIGGCMAMSFAMGRPVPEIVSVFKDTFTKRRVFRQYAIPFHGMLSARRFEGALRDMNGDTLLDDSDIPCFAVSTNLSQSSEAIHRTGPVWKAMRMTSSLPVLFPPVREGREIYVDGGLLDNMPLQPAKTLFEGFYIGLNLSVGNAPSLRPTQDAPPKSWRARLGFAPDLGLPRLKDVLIGSMVLKNAANYSSTLSGFDVLFNPQPPAGIGLLDFKQFDELYRIGYEFALKQLTDMESRGDIADLRQVQP